MAFQPFCVGTVIRTFTGPLASRTGRITPGMTDRTSGLPARNRSRTSRTPSMMLCSTLSRSLAVRRRMGPTRSGERGLALDEVQDVAVRVGEENDLGAFGV